MAKTERIEFRIEPEDEERIRRAAEVRGEKVSAFVLAAALDRADAVITEASTTFVTSDFFDELYAALDEPSRPSRALTRAARRPRRARHA